LSGLGGLALVAYLVLWAAAGFVPERLPFFTPVRGLFGLLAILAVISALAMVMLRNPVHSALALVANFFFLAIIYLLMQQVLLAFLQVLVYAGAIMVLFLFVIMFFFQPGRPDLGSSPIRQQTLGGVLFALAMLAMAMVVIFQGASRRPQWLSAGEEVRSSPVAYLFSEAAVPRKVQEISLTPGRKPELQATRQEEEQPVNVAKAFGGQVRAIGIRLYTQYLVPFELTSVLILIAIIAAVVMGRDRAKKIMELERTRQGEVSGE